jgi:ABC-type glutathione transport system ATPase component
MNADRILVVTSGELVEEGSHEELIRANGKYAELWSKQIFVKPKDGDALDDKSKIKGRKTPNILNDLTPEMTSCELAKVKSAPALGALPRSQSRESGSGRGGSGNASPERGTSGHKKEV